MNKGKSTVLACLIAALVVVGIVILIKGVLAWTNPTQAPPGGSGGLTSSGSNVGVGTTPNVRLEVYDATDSIFRLTRSGATNPTTFRVGTDSAMVIANSGIDTITLKSGNVGIGTTNPGSKLEVNRGATAGNVFHLAGGPGPSTYTWSIDSNNSLALETNLFVIKNTGNVGIGTASPDSKLTIGDATTPVSGTHALKILHNAAGGWAPISMTNTNGGYTWFLGDGIVGTGTYTIGRGSGALAYINILGGDGKVGIGTASPGQKLTVAGTIESTSGGFKFPDGSVQITAGGGGGSGVWATSGTNIYNTNTGNVGVGNSNPGYKLDVASGGATTARFGTGSGDTVVIGGGSGKITTGTVDPLYSIDGLNYATYLPGMTGQKEETTGTVNLSPNELCPVSDSYCSVIDFNKAEIGSDVWLFYQITDFGNSWQNLVVLLTSASDEKVWYKKEPQNHRLLIVSSASGEVSYRLTAPRFDWQKWSNFSSEPYEGLVVPSKAR